MSKLNYANHQRKSKSKDNESEVKTNSANSSDIFSHMNADNLKYIKNQIKQKNKKNQQLSLFEKDEVNSDLEQQINQIQPPLLSPSSLQAPSLLSQQPFPMTSSQPDPPSPTKLSYYDQEPQTDSNRISSLENRISQQRHKASKGPGDFLKKLEEYIDQMCKTNKNIIDDNDQNGIAGGFKKKSAKIKGRNMSYKRESAISQSSSRQILQNQNLKLKKQKQSLSRQIQEQKSTNQANVIRISNLEQSLSTLTQRFNQIYNLVYPPIVQIDPYHNPSLPINPISINPRYQNNFYNHQNNYSSKNQNQLLEQSHISQRKSRAVSMAVGGIKRGREESGGNVQDLKEIQDLYREYEFFMATGQFQRGGKIEKSIERNEEIQRNRDKRHLYY